MSNNLEKYFVCGSEEVPDRLYFKLEDAVAHHWVYIDAFDKDGKYVSLYELNDDGTTYTRNVRDE